MTPDASDAVVSAATGGAPATPSTARLEAAEGIVVECLAVGGTGILTGSGTESAAVGLDEQRDRARTGAGLFGAASHTSTAARIERAPPYTVDTIEQDRTLVVGSTGGEQRCARRAAAAAPIAPQPARLVTSTSSPLPRFAASRRVDESPTRPSLGSNSTRRRGFTLRAGKRHHHRCGKQEQRAHRSPMGSIRTLMPSDGLIEPTLHLLHGDA